MMNCQTTRRLLEVCRPSGDDLASPVFAGAAAHLEECCDCLTHFRAQQAFEARVVAAVQAVTVPVGLRERIHARLDRRVSIRRGRKMMAWAAVAAAVVLAACTYFRPHSEELSVAIIAADKIGELAILNESDFADSRDVPPELEEPARISAWCTRKLRELKLNAAPSAKWPLSKLVSLGRTNLAGRAVAVFQYDDPRGPSDVLAFPHNEFDMSDVGLGPQPIHRTRNLVVVAWVEGGTTYVAVLKGWAPEDWKQLVGSTGGLT